MSEGGARGVVVAHGTMAQGMVDAVRRIAGAPADALVAVSNDGLGPAELRERVATAWGAGPVVVFCDLESGSCGLAASSSCLDHPARTVVCGVNLPILLDFVFHRDLPLHELVPRLLERGRSGIRGLGTE